MIININMKQIGKKRQKISTIPLEYKEEISTIGELITETVHILVQQYMEKLKNSKTGEPISQTSSYSSEQFADLLEIGKISFGMLYNDNVPDEQNAIETALTAFEDGLVRIFINNEEIGAEDTNLQNVNLHQPVLRQTEPISLKEGDTITFIRMTFLAGRMY